MSMNWITPDLARNPSLAFDVANQKNPNAAADLISHTAKTVAVSDAVNNHIATTDSQGFWSKLGHGAVTGLEWLGKPLQEVQKDYKFVHFVEGSEGRLPRRGYRAVTMKSMRRSPRVGTGQEAIGNAKPNMLYRK